MKCLFTNIQKQYNMLKSSNITKPSKGGAGLLLMKAELSGDLVDTMFISGPTQHLQAFLINYKKNTNFTVK